MHCAATRKPQRKRLCNSPGSGVMARLRDRNKAAVETLDDDDVSVQLASSAHSLGSVQSSYLNDFGQCLGTYLKYFMQ